MKRHHSQVQVENLLMLENEVCRCHHERLLHTDTVGGLAQGHGFCAVGGCACPKFTWTRYKDEALALRVSMAVRDRARSK